MRDPSHLGREGRGAGEQLAGGFVGDHLAVAEEDDPVGHLGGQLDVVGGHDDGAPGVPQPLQGLSLIHI